MKHVRRPTNRRRTGTGFTQRPSPLEFWYRQSTEPLTAVMFHTDLLTPGLVRPDDPAADHVGHEPRRAGSSGAADVLRDDSAAAAGCAHCTPAPVDWTPLFTLAGLDLAQLKTAEPLWTWLAASDTRAAWTGAWPESGRPLRVEAAALGGRPVAFMLVGALAQAVAHDGGIARGETR